MSLRAPVRLLATNSVPRFSRGRELASTLCASCQYRLLYRQRLRQGQNFATVAAERPQTLHPEQPPRNAGAANTSITSGGPPSFQRYGVSSSHSQHEGDAQKPQPAPDIHASSLSRGSLISETSPPERKPARKSKLRPRKAAMTLTSDAVIQLKDLLQQPDPKMIRVGVKNRGCSGLAYHLEYVDKAGKFDEAVEQDGVKVLVDSKALFSIIGSEMDWQEDKLSARFVFRNPNIKEQCGCGESFSVS